ncbi:MAG: hypothetical protein Kow0088_07910 [Anaerolineales bacterium]
MNTEHSDESLQLGQETKELSEETPPPQEPVSPAPAAVAPKKEGRLRRFLRQLVRWTLGILILVGIGFVAAILVFYMPLRRENAIQATELSKTQARITELEGQLAEKAQLEKQYQDALERLKMADFQNNVLNLQVEIASARVYLYENKQELAATALKNAQSILKALQTAASPAQRPALNEMEARLNLAIAGIEKDIYAAQSDLDVLARSLSDFSASLTASSP